METSSLGEVAFFAVLGEAIKASNDISSNEAAGEFSPNVLFGFFFGADDAAELVGIVNFPQARKPEQPNDDTMWHAIDDGKAIAACKKGGTGLANTNESNEGYAVRSRNKHTYDMRIKLTPFAF